MIEASRFRRRPSVTGKWPNYPGENVNLIICSLFVPWMGIEGNPATCRVVRVLLLLQNQYELAGRFPFAFADKLLPYRTFCFRMHASLLTPPWLAEHAPLLNTSDCTPDWRIGNKFSRLYPLRKRRVNYLDIGMEICTEPLTFMLCARETLPHFIFPVQHLNLP